MHIVIENREGKRSTASSINFLRGFQMSHDSYTGTDDDCSEVGRSANESGILKSDKTFSGA